MHPYYCSVSFRIFHPKFSADEICKKIGLIAYRKWTVGQPKTTIKGQLLKGVNAETFCIFHLIPTRKIGLEEFVGLSMTRIAVHKKYLDDLCATGGRLELYVSCFLNKNSGMVFDWKKLSGIADCRIALVFDLFPENRKIRDLPKNFFRG